MTLDSCTRKLGRKRKRNRMNTEQSDGLRHSWVTPVVSHASTLYASSKHAEPAIHMVWEVRLLLLVCTHSLAGVVDGSLETVQCRVQSQWERALTVVNSVEINAKSNLKSHACTRTMTHWICTWNVHCGSCRVIFEKHTRRTQGVKHRCVHHVHVAWCLPSTANYLSGTSKINRC